MTDAELVGSTAHVYVRGKAGHRPGADCPCRPATPLTTARHAEIPVDAALYVHRPFTLPPRPPVRF